MSDAFVHLHVASGYSLQHGASSPATLVERAVEHGMDTLALTDRDGTYGAVKFAKACLAAGVRPVLGVDLAVARTMPWDAEGRRVRPGGVQTAPAPVRGGAYRDDRLPRVTVLAAGRAGWGALCRLVSATHLTGERGTPVATLATIAEHAADGDLLVMVGPASEVGEAVTRRRADHAEAALSPWLEALPRESVLVEVVSHRLRGDGPGSTTHAARTLSLAHRLEVPSVLTNVVRHADRRDAPTVDVLDAARRLVALDSRHVDRGNAEGFVKSGKEMADVAEDVAIASGLEPRTTAQRLLARTRLVADRCALDPRADLGLGEVHFPEFELAAGPPYTGPGAPPPAWGAPADVALRLRCEAAVGDRYGSVPRQRIWKRLDDELETIRTLGYASYFLTVGDVTDLIRDMGVRCAARGSGAGSLVTYLLGISGVDPLRHGLLMERFLSPLRQALPDIDVDVESARRTEVYEKILARYGGERCVCVSMMDTYRVRHAVRDVGAALGMPPGEVDAIAKAFPHVRARDARTALGELPELRASGLAERRLDLFFDLVERLDGLPRHVAVHPCGVLLSDATLLSRTPVEASYAGFPMSQFDKDDVEDLGLLKLDVLGIRMQSAMAHAVEEVSRVEGERIDLDDESQVPFDDPATFSMISAARTLGCFQIESPGQRELVGKSGIDSFADIVADISLFRPGPVKSDMITPYLEAKQGWRLPSYLHEDLRPILEGTQGVVVFHEQVIEMIATLTGITNAEADEVRRSLGDAEGMAEAERWFIPLALERGYPLPVVERVWSVLRSFASFGFCKAHAAAFALPTYQSAWLKAHWPAHFLAGVLTHDPGMYPKRLILDDARQLGVTVLGLDVDASEQHYRVERLRTGAEVAELDPATHPGEGLPDGRAWGIRIAMSEVKGISEAEVARIVAARPYDSLTDFWQRTQVSRPVVERIVLAGGFDGVYAIGSAAGVGRRAAVTRRDLLLQVAELDRRSRVDARASRGRARGLAGMRARSAPTPASVAAQRAGEAAERCSTEAGIRERAAAQSRATRPVVPVDSVQLALGLGDDPVDRDPDADASSVEGAGQAGSVGLGHGLPEMDAADRVGAELEILGLDASEHLLTSYADFLAALGTTGSQQLLQRRSKAELLVAGVKVATQTPPIRSGRRVIFLTLDDGTGPVDATFFEDAQGPYAATVFHSWLMVVRGELRRTGKRGVSLRATGCWELPALHRLWESEGMDAVLAVMAERPLGFAAGPGEIDPEAVAGAASSRSPRPVMASPSAMGRHDRNGLPPGAGGSPEQRPAAGGMGRRRVLVHSNGFKVSPYADIKPAGESTRSAPRKLWHSSGGSAGA
ncbi:DNA polymerase III subunit alpha [Nocardioidaceae bacterium]|nr:DNA polymerase III subunit alpha [Nocardioidaceae bacterium]